MSFSKNYLSAQSQPWAREVQKRVTNLESAFRSAEVNNTTRDDQLASSFRRLDATFIKTQQASEDAIDAINRVLGLGQPNGDPVDGDNLIDRTVNGAAIVTGSVTANEINANYIYAGTIDADQINAGTLVGFTIKTKNSGQRVELANSAVSFFDDFDRFTGQILAVGEDRGATLEIKSTGSGQVQVWQGGVLFYAAGGPFASISSNGFGCFNGQLAAVGADLVVSGNSFYNPALTMEPFGETNRQMKVNAGGQFEAFGFRSINNMNVGGDLFASPPVGSGSTVQVTSGNKFVKISSSLRYKEEVEDIKIDYDLLTSMKVKTFKFKNDVKEYGEKAQKIYGFIAEELHDMGLVDFVIYENLRDGTTRPDGINQDSIFAATYKLVQMQSEKIKSLENITANLSHKIKELQNDNS